MINKILLGLVKPFQNNIFNLNNKYYRGFDVQKLKKKAQKKQKNQFKQQMFQHYLNNDKITELISDQNQKIKNLRETYHMMQEQIRNKHIEKIKQKEQFGDMTFIADKQQMQEQLEKNRKIFQQKLKSIQNQFKKGFVKQNKDYQEKYIKQYMLNNVQQSQKQETKPSADYYYIPNNLILKKLAHQKNIKQILLIGLQKNNEEHCIYTKQLIEKLNVKNILTVVPPDMPYFIKSQSSYQVQWKKFLQTPGPNFKFYLNPSPVTLKDICIQKDYFPYLRYSMNKSKTFYETIYSIMQQNEVSLKYQHEPLFTGLMSNSVQNVYFCDYPTLKERQMMALTIPLQDLRQLVKKQAYFRNKNNVNYSGQLLLPKSAIQKKFNYIMSIAKTVSKSSNEPCVMLCKADMAESLSHQWQKSKTETVIYNNTDKQYYLNVNFNNSNLTHQPPLFIQFIQKLVILDLIISPVIQKFFVVNKSFPFSCYNTVGGKQNLSKVFIIWNHFRAIYSNLIQKQEVYDPVKSGDVAM